MKIRELITEARINNAILTKWINFNPEIATTSTVRQKAKAEKKKELGAMTDDQLEQTLAQMKQEGDQWEEAKKGQGDHRSKAAKIARDKEKAGPDAPMDEVPEEELESAYNDAKESYRNATAQVDDYRKRNMYRSEGMKKANLKQLIFRARADALERALSGVKVNATSTDPYIKSLLRRVKDMGLDPVTALRNVYRGIPDGQKYVESALSRIWTKVDKAPKHATSGVRNPFDTNTELNKPKMTSQGNVTLAQAEKRGIELDDNQTRAIMSGMIATEVRVVKDYGNNYGVLETPLGYMEGPISAIPLRVETEGDNLAGTYAMLSMKVVSTPTDDTLGKFSDPTDIQPYDSTKKETVRVHYGKDQITSVDDADDTNLIKPLRLKGAGNPKKPLPKDIPEPSDGADDGADDSQGQNKSGKDYYNSMFGRRK